VELRADHDDGRASRVWLTVRARRFEPAAERVLAKIEKAAARDGMAADFNAVRRWLTTFARVP
jgi:hypothetical protein